MYTGTVISEILSFDGPEFYIKNWPELTRRKNRSFRSVLFSFEGAIPVGIKRGDGYVTVLPSTINMQQTSSIACSAAALSSPLTPYKPWERAP